MAEHPITPPPELVMQWLEEGPEDEEFGISQHIATQAARWGADQELEECCEWLETYVQRWAEWSANFRADRRPKPPSLKEQALTALSEADQGLNESEWQQRSDTIRRALEQLDD